MSEYIIANSETGEEKAWPRRAGEAVIGLQEPPWHVLEVIREPTPEVAPGQVAVPSKTQDFQNGRLVYGWQMEDLPPPGPKYQEFYDGLIASNVYANVVSTPGKTGDQAAAMTVFLGAISEAKSGRENRPALQSAIWRLLGQMALTEAGLAELQGLMNENHLAGIYQLEPPG
jgi:hypothetical protein